MELFEAYETDYTVEHEGVWVPFPHVNVKVKLARAGGSNKDWEIAREKALRPLRKAYRDRAIPDSEVLDALLEPFCSLIIKDWEGGALKDRKCDQKNKIEVCRKLRDFYTEMVNEAGLLENYLRVEDEEDAGKSQPGLDGTKPTETPAT